MPYDIRRNYRGKSGYSVVSEDGTVRGTHSTRNAAIEQQRALYAAESRMKKEDASGRSGMLYEQLTPDEKAFADAMMEIADQYGKFDEDGSGIWAGYDPASRNMDASIGVKCGNCVHFEGNGECHIIAFQVEENGKCRFAAIPDGYVRMSTQKSFWSGRIVPRANKNPETD